MLYFFPLMFGRYLDRPENGLFIQFVTPGGDFFYHLNASHALSRPSVLHMCTHYAISPLKIVRCGQMTGP
jgi:hypothetical protein